MEVDVPSENNHCDEMRNTHDFDRPAGKSSNEGSGYRTQSR